MKRGHEYNDVVSVEAEKLRAINNNGIILLALCEILRQVERITDAPEVTALVQELERRGHDAKLY